MARKCLEGECWSLAAGAGPGVNVTVSAGMSGDVASNIFYKYFTKYMLIFNLKFLTFSARRGFFTMGKFTR